MSLLGDALRPYWLKGLNDISGSPSSGVAELFLGEKFQVFDNPTKNIFSISFADETLPLQAIAFDSNRLASAAIETITAVQRHPLQPKSTAWLVIKTYYGAFLAAHAILRMFGISCIQLQSQHIKSFKEIASLYEMDTTITTAGFYTAVFHSQQKTFRFCRQDKESVHEALWHEFVKLMTDLAERVLKDKRLPDEATQEIYLLLQSLIENLTAGKCYKGNWLSSIRNDVNYKQLGNTWFPDYQSKQTEQMYAPFHLNAWKGNPGKFSLDSHPGDDLIRFQFTCNFIISFCRDLIEDMSARCSTGRSFFYRGAYALLKF